MKTPDVLGNFAVITQTILHVSLNAYKLINLTMYKPGCLLFKMCFICQSSCQIAKMHRLQQTVQKMLITTI